MPPAGGRALAEARTTTSPCSRRRTSSVVGDFSNARFSYGGVTSTFSRRDGKFVVRTDGPDGTLHDYDVKYTFGVAPLQQYLIELPGGRLQALSIAWDTRPKAQGGQRWFHLYPGQNVTHRDELHWTGLSQNWNYMCAECHSTGVRKHYDAEEPRRFNTSLRRGQRRLRGLPRARLEPRRVGPQGRRLAASSTAARRGSRSRCDDRRGVTWTIGAETGNAGRSPGVAPVREIEMCGRCHARRGQFAEDYAHGRPLGDTHRVALLEDRLYYADGQIRDEVYEYGSFLQSKMFSRGVTCSDCHDPHSLELRGTGEPGVPQLPRRPEVRGGDASLPPERARAAPTASAATCRPRPTWWSIRATTTAFVSRGPISR